LYSLFLNETTRLKGDRCPLDPNVQKRTYIKGEAVCRLNLTELMIILNRRFEKQYREFRQVCQRKGAKSKSLKVARDGTKRYPESEQLEIESFLEED